MPDRSRFALAACWIAAAGLLVRMASGGSLLGLLYVVRVVDPMTLAVGACAILSAAGVTLSLLAGPSHRTLRLSIFLSLAVIPYSLILSWQGHGSAWGVGTAGLVALAIAVRNLDRPMRGTGATELPAARGGDRRLD